MAYEAQMSLSARHALLVVFTALFFHPTSFSPTPGTAQAAPSASKPFGIRLADAALSQRWIPTIYNPAYVKIPYPNGDVPRYFGVCTDVIVRAYRELGIDLQQRVHRAHVGSGDTNIDHRRVRVLRKFFARQGKTLSTTKDPALYKPGDIVTYRLPAGGLSPTHIAIVTQYKSTMGIPLVVHNRGYSVQLEDWLFSAKITGHYRFGR